MFKPTRFLISSAIVAFVCASLFSASIAVAQSDKDTPVANGADDSAEKDSRKTPRSRKSVTKEDRSLIEVFESITISATDSTVKVQSGDSQIAVGTIVDENGLILTKASEMRGKLNCRLPNGDVLPAKVFGIDKENDLALLKIDAEGLSVAPLNPVGSSPERGMWLASPTDHNGALTVGVVGVAERKIPPSRAFIGISMDDMKDDGGVRIVSIVDGSPAKKSKLRVDDVIVKLDDAMIKNRQELVKVIGKYSPGTDISLTVKRKDKELIIKLTLADIQRTSRMDRSRTQNSMGSRLSSRGKDFPRAFQHDMALEAKHCGGPVVDLDGQIIGINIARSGRVSSLAIPVDVVVSVIEKLKSGEYSPVKVHAERIERSEEELSEMQVQLKSNKKEYEESEESVEDSDAKIEELERMKKEISDRIKEVYKDRNKLAKRKRVLRSKNSAAEKSIRALRQKIELYKSGKRY